ncbi:MAG: hypothetical protein M3381_11065, partial [Actinomycetota bacterium]|nr:hypothetical protein [Actinomycetota bacterium]
VGPMKSGTSTAEHAGMNTAGGEAAAGGSVSEEIPGGLLVSQDGYTLELAQKSLSADDATPLAVQVLGPDIAPVAGYELTHDRELHLIAVRRHLAGFLHVHPRTSRGRHLEHPAGPDRRPMAAVHRSSRQAMTTNSEESR